jgi:hypothetical protein
MMNRNRALAAMALGFTLAATGIAHAGAPQPETRQGDFAHVCSRGPNRGLECTVATQDVDCPGSVCVVQVVGPTARGTLTIIAHDSVTDWANGGSPNQALTVLLEVKAPSGPQMLAATYQNVLDPTLPPNAPGNVVSIDLDEGNLAGVAAAVGDLLFVQPEAALATELQELFETTGIPVLVDATEGSVRSADHTADPLATVVRFKVKIRFLAPEPL